MQFFLTKIEQLGIGWNRRRLTEEDFYTLCRRHKVTIEELPLRVSGFYYSVAGRHFIAVNSNLAVGEKLFVMFHEFAHFLLHAPDSGATANFHGIGRKTRKEREADMFALVALIPQQWLIDRAPGEIIESENVTAEKLRERMEIFNARGI